MCKRLLNSLKNKRLKIKFHENDIVSNDDTGYIDSFQSEKIKPIKNYIIWFYIKEKNHYMN